MITYILIKKKIFKNYERVIIYTTVLDLVIVDLIILYLLN